ncbi:MAG: putative flavoprotein involved in transport [Actinomycetota bacterium]
MRTTTVIVGAGHAGLAMSRRLTERSIEHVVLERGEVANSWRTERWPSLRLLTPNWQTTLPEYAYDGDDPDGYMAVAEVVDTIARYAKHVDAPVQTNTTVESVCASGDGYRVVTDQGAWDSRTVVLASGACNRASVPACAAGVPDDITCITPIDYRGPDALADGGVLVVGGSATGAQLAHEIHLSGRPVTLATGELVRMPRVYRGRDIFYWMDQAGILDERYDALPDIARARHVPSPQLVGTPERVSLDLNSLRAVGVRIVGKLGAISDGRAQFAGGLANIGKLSDLKMHRLLDTIDEYAGFARDDSLRPEPTALDADPPLSLDLTSGEITTIVWATGYRPEYSWLGVPVLDRKGQIKHDGGVVTESPGLYVLGLPFLRRRRSTFLHGASTDTADLAAHLAASLA